MCDDPDAGVTDSGRCHAGLEKPTLRNKIGVFFTIEVPKSLTVSRLVFDALDSLGDWTPQCLGDKTPTCGFAGGHPTEEVAGCGCAVSTVQLEHCNFHAPTSLFRVRYSPANALATAKSLVVADCEFHHFFYQLNALIQLPPEGASLSITGSSFLRFSSCGSLISNRFDIPYDPDTRFPSDHFNAYLSKLHY